jgi:hypothetical protein
MCLVVAIERPQVVQNGLCATHRMPAGSGPLRIVQATQACDKVRTSPREGLERLGERQRLAAASLDGSFLVEVFKQWIVFRKAPGDTVTVDLVHIAEMRDYLGSRPLLFRGTLCGPHVVEAIEQACESIREAFHLVEHNARTFIAHIVHPIDNYTRLRYTQDYTASGERVEMLQLVF